MKFELNESNQLALIAESQKEVLEVLSHSRLPVLDHLSELGSGVFTHTLKGTWVPVEIQLDQKWIDPYLAKLEKITGYYYPIPDIVPFPRYSEYCVNLCHTHMIEEATLIDTLLTFKGYQQLYSEKTDPIRSFAERVREDLGVRPEAPRLLSNRRKNPDFGKIMPPVPALKNRKVFNAFVQWWYDNKATESQRLMLDKCYATHRTVCNPKNMGDWLMAEYSVLHPTWDTIVTFEEFKKLS